MKNIFVITKRVPFSENALMGTEPTPIPPWPKGLPAGKANPSGAVLRVDMAAVPTG